MARINYLAANDGAFGAQLKLFKIKIPDYAITVGVTGHLPRGRCPGGIVEQSGEYHRGRLTKDQTTNAPRVVAGRLYFVVGSSLAAFTISASSFWNASKPLAGMMMVSRRPPTSSLMRRNRPRMFSLSTKTKVFRSIGNSACLSVSSLTGGLRGKCGGCP